MQPGGPYMFIVHRGNGCQIALSDLFSRAATLFHITSFQPFITVRLIHIEEDPQMYLLSQCSVCIYQNALHHENICGVHMGDLFCSGAGEHAVGRHRYGLSGKQLTEMSRHQLPLNTVRMVIILLFAYL